MEVIECGTSEFAPDTCSVCIVNDFKFRAVDTSPINNDRIDFCEWWPTAARTLIAGLFGDVEMRRSAAKAMLVLTEIKFVKVSEPKQNVAMDGDRKTLQDLYATRLMFDEQHMKVLCDAWMERVNHVYEKGATLIRQNTSARDGIRRIAKGLTEKHSNDLAAQNIIEDELKKAQQRLAHDVERNMRLFKAESMTDVRVSRPPDLHQLDQQIWHCTQRLSVMGEKENAQEIRSAYHDHLQNATCAIMQKLREMCMHRWMNALR